MDNENLEYINDLILYESERAFPKKKVYVDTYDVVNMIQGWRCLYDNFRKYFNKHLFDSERFFCQMLFFYGEIGCEIHILPSHQKELHYLLDRHFQDIELETNSNKIIEELIHDAQIVRGEKVSFEKLNDKEKNDFIKEESNEGINSFNVKTALYPLSWKQRLSHLFFGKKLIILDESKPVLLEYLNDPIYDSCLEACSKLRPDSKNSINNLHDAAALCSLSRELKRFNSGEIEEMPLFFDPSGFFGKVVTEASLTQYFIPKDGSKSIIRGTKYFFIRCLFSPPYKKKKGKPRDIEIEAFQNHMEEIESIRLQLNKSQQDIDNINPKELNVIENKIKEYLDKQFLKYVLINVYQDTSYNDFFKRIKLEKSNFKNKGFIEELDFQITTVKTGISKRLQKFSEEIKLWSAIYSSAKEFSRRSDSNSALVGIFGLIQFALSAEEIKIVEAKYGLDGLLSENEIRRIDSAKFILENLAYSKNDIALSNVRVAYAGLWILELYPQIVELGKRNHKKDFSLAMFYAAASSKCGFHLINKIRRVMDFWENSLDVENNNLANIYIGLSYLHYRIWVKDHVTAIQSEEEPHTNEDSQLAIYYAEMAFKNLNSKRLSFKSIYEEHQWLYSYNIFCYYLIQAGKKASLLKNQSKIIKFLEMKSENSGLWNARYDDTIARYYHRMSLYQKENKLLMMRKAYQLVSKAVQQMPENNDLATYYLQLSKYNS